MSSACNKTLMFILNLCRGHQEATESLKICLRQQLRPGCHWDNLLCSPRHLSQLGRGFGEWAKPLPYALSLRARFHPSTQNEKWAPTVLLAFRYHYNHCSCHKQQKNCITTCSHKCMNTKQPFLLLLNKSNYAIYTWKHKCAILNTEFSGKRLKSTKTHLQCFSNYTLYNKHLYVGVGKMHNLQMRKKGNTATWNVKSVSNTPLVYIY